MWSARVSEVSTVVMVGILNRKRDLSNSQEELEMLRVWPPDTKRRKKYYCHTGKWEGVLSVHRMCMDCRSVTEHLFCGFAFGQVWDELRDHLYDTRGEISWEKVARLTPAAREKVCDVIENVWRQEEG